MQGYVELVRVPLPCRDLRVLAERVASGLQRVFCRQLGLCTCTLGFPFWPVWEVEPASRPCYSQTILQTGEQLTCHSNG